MMNALEQEIVEKFQRLDSNARLRVLTRIEQDVHQAHVAASSPDFDFEAWFQAIETVREQIRADHGGVFPAIDVTQMLREIRDGDDE